MPRKGFNFYASYFDVYNQLTTDKDKVAFIDALLNRQFKGIEPKELKGMANFAYVSQKHSIDQQIKGYEDKTGEKLFTPTQGGCVTPTEQVQEKEKEQGKGQRTPKKEIKVYRTFAHLTLLQSEFDNLLKDFTKDQIDGILDDIQNFKKNTNYTSLNLTARKWLKRQYPTNPDQFPKLPNYQPAN